MKFHQFISYIFHPVLVPMVSTLWFFIVAPVYIPRMYAYRMLLLIFILTYLVPLIMLFLLKKMRLITSYELPSVEERKFPILFAATIYFLIGNLLLKTNVLNLLAFSFFGYTIALALIYLFFQKHLKTSLHTVGIAGMISFIAILSYAFKINLLIFIMLSFLLLGIVATARLQLQVHTTKEIFLGIFVGAISQVLAYMLYLYFYNM